MERFHPQALPIPLLQARQNRFRVGTGIDLGKGLIVEVEHPVAGMVSMVGVPVKLSETPGRVRAPAPLLGQHTYEVIQHYLDLNEAEIAALREAGAIGVKR